MSDIYNATVIEKEYLTDTLFYLRVRPDTGINDFVAGQYIAIGLNSSAPRYESLPEEVEPPENEELIRRTYSIGSPPKEKDYFEFFIALLPQGKLTSRLAALNPGDKLFLGKKPVGSFTLKDLPEESAVTFVATGTGVAPFVSMLSEGSSLTQRPAITLVYGVRYASDFGYASKLEKLENELPAFKLHKVISREEHPGCYRGYVQDLISNQTIALNPEADHVMLCGNPAMIDATEKLLVERGFKAHSRKEPGNLHMEKYW